jgi:hypothetical protein
MSAYRKLTKAMPAELRVDRILPKPFELGDMIDAVEQLVA